METPTLWVCPDHGTVGTHMHLDLGHRVCDECSERAVQWEYVPVHTLDAERERLHAILKLVDDPDRWDEALDAVRNELGRPAARGSLAEQLAMPRR